jgi:hypothetical protein
MSCLARTEKPRRGAAIACRKTHKDDGIFSVRMSPAASTVRVTREPLGSAVYVTRV